VSALAICPEFRRISSRTFPFVNGVESSADEPAHRCDIGAVGEHIARQHAFLDAQ
jgi:hypothetical protein